MVLIGLLFVVEQVKPICNFYDLIGLYILCKTAVRLYQPMNRPTDYVTLEEFRKLVFIIQQNQADIHLSKKQYAELLKEFKELSILLKNKNENDESLLDNLYYLNCR